MGADHGPQVLFSILGLDVTSRVTTMWAIMLLIFIVSFLATRNINRVPSGAQNFMETLVETLLNFFGNVMGFEYARRYLPFLATMFMFIIISNYVGILPGVEKITGFSTPTATWSVTAGWAITVFFATHIYGIKEHGIGYLKQFFEPYPFLFPIMIIEHFVRPLSLSLRLFGNIFGKEMVIAVLLSLIPFLVPIPMLMLGLLLGFVQAVVFTMLTAVYFYEAVEDH